MSVRANKDTFESEINEAGKLVIADFYSDSCVPCKRMSSVPTLVFFKDGAEKARLTGAVKKSQLSETINSID